MPSFGGAERFEAIATLINLVRWRAHHQPNQRAYVFLPDGEAEAQALTYADLDERARTLGAYLQREGWARERALLLLPPGLDYVIGFLGCLYADVTAVPAYPPLLNRTLPRLEAIAADAQARVAIVPAAMLSNLEALWARAPHLRALGYISVDQAPPELASAWQAPDATGDSLAWLQYTSGATAAPRGVMVSHQNALHNMALMGQAMEGTPYGAEPEPFALDAERYSGVVSWLPPHHDMGLIGGILMPLYSARPATLMPPAVFLQHPHRWLQVLTRYQAAYSTAPNFAYDLCVDKITAAQRRALSLQHWRIACCGAEPIRARTIERFIETFAPHGFRREAFYPSYGLAEATLMVTGGRGQSAPCMLAVDRQQLARHRVRLSPPHRDAEPPLLVGCGQTLLHQRIVIVDPDTQVVCPPDCVGEIWVSGQSVAQGYWNRVQETERVFHNFLADSGAGPFLRTGDLGFMHRDNVFITGRLRDLIIIQGVNYYPQDIEWTVERSHPALRANAAAAFALDTGNEEQLVVVQELSAPPPTHLDAVLGGIRQAVARAHGVLASAVVLVRPGSLPRTPSNKIQRALIRAAYQEDALAALATWREDPRLEPERRWRAALRGPVTPRWGC